MCPIKLQRRPRGRRIVVILRANELVFSSVWLVGYRVRSTTYHADVDLCGVSQLCVFGIGGTADGTKAPVRQIPCWWT